MSIDVQPMRNNVLLRLRPVEAQTGRIHRVSHFEAARKADVLAVGPECHDLTAGMGVLCSPLVGQQVGDDLLQPESSVLAILDAEDTAQEHESAAAVLRETQRHSRLLSEQAERDHATKLGESVPDSRSVEPFQLRDDK